MFFKTIMFVFVLCVVVFVGLDVIADPVMEFAARNKEASWAPEFYFHFAGLTFLALKWDLAGIAYRRAVQLFPKHQKVPLGYFRIGKCYEKLGDYKKAVNVYKFLVKKFPDSSVATHAELTIREIEDFFLAE